MRTIPAEDGEVTARRANIAERRRHLGVVFAISPDFTDADYAAQLQALQAQEATLPMVTRVASILDALAVLRAIRARLTSMPPRSIAPVARCWMQ